MAPPRTTLTRTATSTSTPSAAATAGGRRGVGRRLREVVLDTVAVLGTLSLLGTVALVLTGASLVVFRTGSMTPAMPVGALALVVPTPADQVAPGDVVTVARPGSPLPVTHRVVAVEAAAGLGPGGAVLELRGDANEAVDPQPYEVAEVGRVVASAPHLGHWLERARTPPVLAGATLAAAALVAWTFWPATADRPRPTGRRCARRSRR